MRSIYSPPVVSRSCVLIRHFGTTLVGARVVPGGWCHLAFCFDQRQHEMSIVHNGQTVARARDRDPLTHSCALRLGIGASGTATCLEGAIAELRYCCHRSPSASCSVTYS